MQLSLVVFLLLAGWCGAGSGNFARRVASPQLPEDHELLRRDRNAGPHAPEQVRIIELANSNRLGKSGVC
jgi:hypothetical protein